ncbi:MAG: SDR family oxidoreductase [Anaerolineae bacterium]|jgi:NAD(P)-dependent dehydrogenase (short-subunit alcohol dehydrogenase family)|nr:SDR family oxidoreductase [Anaerolineae bacterium]MBT7991094.1 SDR family oxidoreductase [Anaerolineae bacterium]
MKNKICLITGATSGIGQAAALGLAKKGATVIVAGRSEERCRNTVAQIKSETGNSDVEYLVADLSVQAQVRQLAAEFKSRYGHLDVLINNAAAIFLRRTVSADGIEMNFTLNHLNYFLLTSLLLDSLKAADSARIVNVSSNSHKNKQLDLDDLELKRGYNAGKAYGRSKLANLYFTYELARRLKDEGSAITVNAMHPGFVATNMAANNGWFVKLLLPLIHRSSLTPEQGASTAVYLASSPDVEGISGKYFIREKDVSSSPISHDEEIAARLWQVSVEMTK